MNLIANTGIHFLTIPLEIDMNNNFKMYFHEWFDTTDQQKKLEIAHFFAEEEIWVKKHHLETIGYAKKGRVIADWETISNDEEFDDNCIIPVDTEDARDSGCFDVSAGKIKEDEWRKFENKWFPMPFFHLNCENSEFGPTNWCRFKLIPQGIDGKIKKYDLLLAFDTKCIFEKDDFEDEDLNEAPVFTNIADREKVFALCNNEYKLVGYCSKNFNCEWVEKYLLKQYHNVDNINDLKGIQMPKLKYLAQYIFINRYLQQFGNIPMLTLYSNKILLMVMLIWSLTSEIRVLVPYCSTTATLQNQVLSNCKILVIRYRMAN